MKKVIQKLSKEKAKQEKLAKEYEDSLEYMNAVMCWTNAQSIDYAISILKKVNEP